VVPEHPGGITAEAATAREPEATSDQPVFPDSHAHLGYVRERLGQERLDAILADRGNPPVPILDPGVDYDDFPARAAAWGGHPAVLLAAGIWPDTESLGDIDRRVAVLETHVRSPACVAVGECGPDHHWMNASPERQLDLFQAQAALALRYDKPLIVHSREAFPETLAVVRRVASQIPVIIHCFGYGEAEARAFLQVGCWLSFAGNITYRKARGLHLACLATPDDRLLLETDAPYMNPEPFRGRPSSPADICRTYAFVADLRSRPPDRSMPSARWPVPSPLP